MFKIEFTRTELAQLMQFLDLGVQTRGIQVAQVALDLTAKLTRAIKEQGEPETKQDETKAAA